MSVPAVTRLKKTGKADVVRLSKSLLFFVNAGSAGLQWWFVAQFAGLMSGHSPEVLAAAHVHMPPYLIATAVMTTIMAGVTFVRWYRSIPK